MFKEVLSSIQIFNFNLVDNIKTLCNDKAYKKSHLVVHTYNDEKKNLVLMYSSKILEVSQGIDSCLVAIIQDNNNNNIKFYLQDIIQTYVEIASNLNLDSYIWLLFKQIS